ncbi:MAG: protein-tyrosine-phosphatase [Bacteroidetes bacterium]|nr:protein-tyrosine-phosphatase [Bacteroidota bacterium]MDA0904510.1 protein-tyrosine-phosphatase [Bacteroidota bacterium]MDA1242254.1 protein-tyrosine-phosphatase [Bacteroidota bacterium]
MILESPLPRYVLYFIVLSSGAMGCQPSSAPSHELHNTASSMADTTRAGSNGSESSSSEVLNPVLDLLVQTIAHDTSLVTQERKSELNALAQWAADRLAQGDQAPMVFICTHNSRRSHMAQVWAAAAAARVGLHGQIPTFSGGTESTACNPRTVGALERAGFGIDTVVPSLSGSSENPTYAITCGDTVPASICFSKTYSDPANPSTGFAAVMTCSDADRGCPLVYGADARFAVPYVDPKVSDNTAEEAATYDARCRQIGTEMVYLMDQVHQRLESH